MTNKRPTSRKTNEPIGICLASRLAQCQRNYFFQPVSAIIPHLSGGIVPRVFKLLTHSFPSARKSHGRGEWKPRSAAGPVDLCKSDAVCPLWHAAPRQAAPLKNVHTTWAHAKPLHVALIPFLALFCSRSSRRLLKISSLSLWKAQSHLFI